MNYMRQEDADPVCCIPECECIASWEPMIFTWPIGAKAIVKPTEFMLDMPICDMHRLSSKTTDFVCDDIWSSILEWAHKERMPIPDRMTSEVRFKKIKNEKVLH